MAFIGIDLGTSFIKAAVIDVDGYRLSNVRRVPFPEPIQGLESYRVEFDPRQIMDGVTALLREMESVDVAYEGLLMCTQMSCLVMMSDQHAAVSNCIGWRDRRALEPHPSGQGSYHEVLKRIISPAQRRELGNELPAGAPLPFLFWMAEHEELKPGLTPVSLADFVLAQLCDSEPGVESTNAMAYELLDLTKMQWHTQLIHQLSLEKLRWPALRQHGDVVGYFQMRGKRIPCYTPVGDYQCALAGALLADDELSLNISTGSQVSRLTPNLVLGDFQTRPFFDGKFTNTFSHLPAGRSMNVLVDLLSEFSKAENFELQDPWGYVAQSVAKVEQTDLRANISFFPGPCGESGFITNIQENNLSVGTLFKAAFDNMAENYFSCALRIWPEHSWRNIVFSGGLGRKLAVLRTIIEQRFQSKSRLCPVEEDTLLGLMVLAMAFTGRASSVEEAMRVVSSHFSSQDEVIQTSN